MSRESDLQAFIDAMYAVKRLEEERDRYKAALEEIVAGAMVETEALCAVAWKALAGVK